MEKRTDDLIAGDKQAMQIEERALADVLAYYSNKANSREPLDVVGYSRGAFEASKLLNDLKNKVMPAKDKYNDIFNAPPNWQYPTIHVRFVGLLSPVMGPIYREKVWPNALPAADYYYEALDKDPVKANYEEAILTQIQITKDAQTQGGDKDGNPNIYAGDDHVAIGHDQRVLADLMAIAKSAGVKFNS